MVAQKMNGYVTEQTMEGKPIRVEMSKSSPCMPKGYTPAANTTSGNRDDNKIVVTSNNWI